MSSFTVDTFTFDPRPDYPLVTVAKRYRPNAASTSPDALTLIFAHATGFHKEHYEPTLDELWGITAKETGGVPVREAWSIDCPNHGDAAVLNERTLQWGYESTFGWDEYAQIIYLFLSGHGSGLPSSSYFSTHNLVGIGHSMGSIAVLLTLTFPHPPRWRAIILVETMLLSREAEVSTGPHFLLKGAEGRRDVWPSREEAYQLMKARSSFSVWDDRVLRIYCNQGLRDLPTSYYPDRSEGVTLKCRKLQEAACFRAKLGRVRAYNFLADACARVPVHAVFGAVDDYTLPEVKDDVINNASQGRLASVLRVPEAGHLVVQTHPRALAKVLHDCLQNIGKSFHLQQTPSSRL